MVRHDINNYKKKKVYFCEECNFRYADEKLAKKCESWCKKYHSCNIEITKQSIS